MIRNIEPDELTSVTALLTSAGLPTADIATTRWLALLGDFREDALVVAGGVERCGESLLLRSVVTHPDWRGQGLAGSLVQSLHRAAEASGHTETWLMTETAEDYFADHHGYRSMDRTGVPEGIQASSQFAGLCPDTATLMVRRIAPVANEG